MELHHLTAEQSPPPIGRCFSAGPTSLGGPTGPADATPSTQPLPSHQKTTIEQKQRKMEIYPVENLNRRSTSDDDICTFGHFALSWEMSTKHLENVKQLKTHLIFDIFRAFESVFYFDLMTFSLFQVCLNHPVEKNQTPTVPEMSPRETPASD